MMNAAAGIFLAARRKPRLPYVECQCIRSSGRAYIVLPHTHTDRNHIKIECEYRYTGSVQYDINLFGGSDVSDQNGCTEYKASGYRTVVQLYGPTRSYDPVENNNEDTSGEFNKIVYTFDASSRPARVFELNGSTSGSATTPATSNNYSYVSAIKMAIFTQTKGGVAMTNRVVSNIGIRSFRYWDGPQNLVADLISCIDENGVGYFFNRVDNARIYKTSTSGSLVPII